MTTDFFKDEVDRLDSGLPAHPDLASYRRQGRAVRRRRRGVAVLGAGALAAAVITPAVLTSGGPPTRGTAPESSPSVAAGGVSSADVPPGPVTPAFGEGLRAAVTESFPGARFVADRFYDDIGPVVDGVRDATVSSPPHWADVFTWTQQHDVAGLQSLQVSAEWQYVPGSMRWCDDRSFQVEKSCQVTEVDGYTVVTHDGVHIAGEDEGDWSRMVEVVSPPSQDSGARLVTEAWAQAEDTTWAEADATLPGMAKLIGLAEDPRLRLPEPDEIP